ncbi:MULTISPECIES: 3-oxoacyl-ACP reductase FabG [unclassified Sphingomonas]|uniref:3-oxoacyl-ACP reductase FabG n=1 Tax=unclassified Sphingomonas TaxID=196159 RepID=UPI00083567AA|nr:MULTISPECIES: 3-oxoacyl-ACP reductase FabG [unclassified Sphingomonas]
MSELSAIPERRVAVVTGAARGIGAAIALRLAEDGCDVAVLDLNAEACGGTVAEVQARGRRAIAVAANVADETAVAEAVARVAADLGPPLILVNNAGILRDKTLGKLTLDDWTTVIDVNLTAAFLMSREVLPAMKAARWGRIVNLSSIAALGVFGETNYSAAKAGVLGLTRTLAIELGAFGVTVNAVAPGFVVTDMTRAVAERMNMTMEALIAEMMKDIRVGRPGMPDDIANAVSYFADPRSSFTTGQTLYVAGAPRG